MGNLDGCGNKTSFIEDFFQATSLLNDSIELHNSKDNHRNSYGKLLSELWCVNNLIVLNGRMKGKAGERGRAGGQNTWGLDWLGIYCVRDFYPSV